MLNSQEGRGGGGGCSKWTKHLVKCDKVVKDWSLSLVNYQTKHTEWDPFFESTFEHCIKLYMYYVVLLNEHLYYYTYTWHTWLNRRRMLFFGKVIDSLTILFVLVLMVFDVLILPNGDMPFYNFSTNENGNSLIWCILSIVFGKEDMTIYLWPN